MLVTLVVLLAMVLSGLALVRSVDTTNVVAGNLAFRHAASHAADIGIETAVDWLQQAGTMSIDLNVSHYGAEDAAAYVAFRSPSDEPPAAASWDAYWQASLQPISRLIPGAAGQPEIRYVIQRLCSAQGNPADPESGVRCSISPANISSGNSKGGGIGLMSSGQIYYRITCRIFGPGNTVSYVQSVVLL
ncbi:MAG: hypothetical protein ACK443_09570 [Methylococcaceae bacterium]|jgi:type IV pilus assembly protein PilX